MNIPFSFESKCDICGREWVAVFPEGIEEDYEGGAECPDCHNMSGYPKEETNYA